MVPSFLRRTLLAFLVVALGPAAEARAADWMFTPFVGTSFGTETSYIILETDTASSKLIFGGSAALLSRGIFGVEGDFALAPRFFERDKGGNLTGSNVNTLSGSVIAAVPLSVTRESLRPYVVGGFGLMHAAAQLRGTDVFSFDDNFAGFNVGGGAIGLISPRTGFRFEIRHFRSIQAVPNALTGEDSARLSFWRATVGVVIRLAK